MNCPPHGYQSLLARTLEHALTYLDSLNDVPVAATANLDQLRTALSKPLPEQRVDAVSVIDQLVRDVNGGLNHNASGRFFGWVMGGAVPASVAADWLTSAWDQNSAMYAVAPAAAVVEEVCGAWLLELLALPASASFALVTGCQLAHVTCLAAARNACLNKLGWDVEKKGLVGAPPIVVLTGDQRHGTIERALRLLGMGSDCIVDISSNSKAPGCLPPTALREQLERCAPGQGLIVLLQAGDLNTGAFDNFEELIPLAHEYGAWVHVDGAFGLWAATSEQYRHLTQGVEAADSWATDGHKWLNVPYDCGYAIVANRAAHFRAFSHHASYLSPTEEARDPLDWNPDHSRRARGFATYAAIASLGRRGIADIVEAGCGHADRLVEAMGRLPQAEVVCRPQINQGLVRFVDPRPGATLQHHDACTEAVVSAIARSGEAFFTCTTWAGRRCCRISVSGWNTTDADVQRSIMAVTESLADIVQTLVRIPLLRR